VSDICKSVGTLYYGKSCSNDFDAFSESASLLDGIQCFDAVVWVTGRASGF